MHIGRFLRRKERGKSVQILGLRIRPATQERNRGQPTGLRSLVVAPASGNRAASSLEELHDLAAELVIQLLIQGLLATSGHVEHAGQCRELPGGELAILGLGDGGNRLDHRIVVSESGRHREEPFHQTFRRRLFTAPSHHCSQHGSDVFFIQRTHHRRDNVRVVLAGDGNLGQRQGSRLFIPLPQRVGQLQANGRVRFLGVFQDCV